MAKNRRSFRYFAAFILFLACLPAFAQVDQSEIQQDLGPVVFINYEGPYARIDTRAQIRELGAGLGRAVKAGAERSGGNSRYYVIHSVSPADGDKLDSDIFALGADTSVDHIRNLRLIIQGYLEEAYAYSPADAALIANYVTIYNAVYRGNWDYFGKRYKAPVMADLSPDRAGLSIRFDEWPGQCQILIPLGTGGPGSLSAVDTSAVSDKEVVEEMRKQDDRGIEQRQDMVDLKEREASDAAQKAQLQREAIKDEEKKIADERAKNQQEKAKVDQERQQTQQEAAAGKTPPEDAAKKNDELDQRQQAAEQKEQELDQRQQQVDQQKEEAQKNEDLAKQKTGEAQQEREDIAKDQQEQIDNQDSRGQGGQGSQGGDQVASAAGQAGGQPPAQAPKGVLGARIEKQGTSTGRLVMLNPDSGAVLVRSALDTVDLRTVNQVGGKIIAIAGKNVTTDTATGAIRLVEIAADTLAMAKQGDDDIQQGSPMWVNGSDIYAITTDGTNCYLGKFTPDLAKQAQSAAAVNQFAALLFQGDTLVTQRADGSPLLLKAADLTEAGK